MFSDLPWPYQALGVVVVVFVLVSLVIVIADVVATRDRRKDRRP